MALHLVLSFIFLLVIAALLPLARKKCPSCGKRGARFRHQRQDGGRDLRYKVNPLLCPSCGYVEGDNLPREREVSSLRQPSKPSGGIAAGKSFQGYGVPHSLFLSPHLHGELPPLSLLDEVPPREPGYSEEKLETLARQIEAGLKGFKIEAKVVGVYPGPVITRFEVELGPGVRSSQLVSLQPAIARELQVRSARIVEIIAGKSVVGLDIPSANKQTVHLSEILRSDKYDAMKSPLTLALGKDIGGHPAIVDLAEMPHLLVAGTTSSGKSMAVNAMVLSLLYKASPKDVRMIMIDPKMLELGVYEGIPHLLAPVVTDMKEAANALRWCAAEMNRRFKLMAHFGVRSLCAFNTLIENAESVGRPLLDPLHKAGSRMPSLSADSLETFPMIAIIADGYLDRLAIEADKEFKDKSVGLISMLSGRAQVAGIHMILSAQWFAVEEFFSRLGASGFSRLAFHASREDESLEVLGQAGAELLEPFGDMLYSTRGRGMPERVHGAFVHDHEVHSVVAWLRGHGGREYPVENEDRDEDEDIQLYDKAVAIVTQTRRASISGVQRHLRIGYNRAARLIEQMEADGVVSAPQHNGNREVLAPPPPK